MVRNLPGLLVCAALVLAGCGSGDGDEPDPAANQPPATPSSPASASATPTSNPRCPTPPARPVGVRDGFLDFRVIDAEKDLFFLVGTHAELRAKGMFVRIRVSVFNTDASFQKFHTRDQLLIDGTGKETRPSPDAMPAKREPVDVSLGAKNRLEFDLWYDVPKDSKLVMLRAKSADGCGRRIVLPRAKGHT